MSYRYRVLSKSEDRQRERDEKSCLEMDLAFVAAEVASLKLKIKCPAVRFITECNDGYISRDQSVDGYCPYASEIVIKAGLSPARMVDVVIHEVRHAWQWGQLRYAKLSPNHWEADAKTWTLEFWALRAAESDGDKLLVQLCEIGAPLAMDAGDELAAQFYVEELKATAHPAAARLDKQYVEWCRIRERAETPRSLYGGHNNSLLDEIRKNYYEKILPARYEAYIKPHMRMFQVDYSRGIPR